MAEIEHAAENDAPPVRLNGYITRPQLWALDEACKPLRTTFPDYGPYLVGSVMERPTFRDVDVRLILSDEQYDRLSDDGWGLLGFVTSRHLAAVTDLPIDFQFQRHTEANAAYGDKFRTPLGLRGDGYWRGDQRPETSVFPPVESCLCRDPLREVHAGCPLHGHSPESVFPPAEDEEDECCDQPGDRFCARVIPPGKGEVL